MINKCQIITYDADRSVTVASTCMSVANCVANRWPGLVLFSDYRLKRLLAGRSKVLLERWSKES